MGWVNYLVFEEEKVAFELSKSASYYRDGEIEEDAHTLERLTDLVMNDVTIEAEIRKLTLEDMIHILKVYFETISLDDNIFEKMFIFWFMQSGNTNFKIMHQEEFAKIITPDYKVFEKKWDGDFSESTE